MEIKKHNQELAERIELLDTGADKQLALELMELHEEKCKECQEDRLGCTVRPACNDRNFLNMLIEIGVEPQDLPSYCYKQHLGRIRKFILERKGRGINDRRIPIKDLLSTLSVPSIRQFNIQFSKVWKKYSRAREHDLMLVAGDSFLFHFNFARGVVILNPVTLPIDKTGTFKLYVDLLSEHYGVPADFSDVTLNWWVLRLSSKATPTKSTVSNLEDFLSERFEASHISAGDDTLEIQIEVISDGNSEPVYVGDLVDIFKKVKSLKKSR